MSESDWKAKLVTLWPLLVGALLIAIWALWPREAAKPVATAPVESPPPEPPAVQAPAKAPVRAAPPPRASAAAPAPAPVASYQEPLYELPIVGPHPDDPHEEAMHPHPITAEHVRISKINGMIQNLNDAMANRDVKAMRKLVAEYRAIDPKDEDNQQLGYLVVADCIETPGSSSLAAAHRYYDTYGASPLRRFIRRICFEGLPG